MNEHKRIVKNTGILMGMELGTGLLEVLMSVVLARYLAPQGYGMLSFATAYVSLFSILAGSGLGTLITRNLARDNSELNRYFANGLALMFCLSLLTLSVIAGTAWFGKFPFEKSLIVFLAAILMLFEMLNRFLNAFFRSRQEISTVAWLNTLMSVGWMVVTLIVIMLKGHLVEILSSRILISLGVVLYSIRLLSVRVKTLQWKVDPSFIRQIFKKSVPFAIFTLFVRIYVKIDIVMLAFIKGDIVTGWYAVSQKFRQALTFIPSSVSGATLPAMAKFSKESKHHLIQTLTRSCKYVSLIALPIAGGTSLIADKLVLLLYGSVYQEAIVPLRIVIWTIVFAFLNSSMSSALLAVNKEKQVTYALGSGAFFNIISNLIAIPLWGHVGAAATTVLSEAVVLVFQCFFLRKALPDAKPLKEMTKLILATGVMMAFTWGFRDGQLPVIIAVAALVYTAAIILLRVLSQDEKEFLLNALLRRKTLQEIK